MISNKVLDKAIGMRRDQNRPINYAETWKEEECNIRLTSPYIILYSDSTYGILYVNVVG